jgi:hypothetical protein
LPADSAPQPTGASAKPANNAASITNTEMAPCTRVVYSWATIALHAANTITQPLPPSAIAAAGIVQRWDRQAKTTAPTSITTSQAVGPRSIQAV